MSLTPKVVLDKKHFIEEASVIVFKEGDKVYALNTASKAIIAEGADAATVIQQAINALTPGRTHKEIVCVRGDMGVLSTGITIPSYTIFDARQARFQAPPSGYAFIIGGAATESWFIDVLGLKLQGNTTANGGIKLDHANYCSCYDVDVGFDVGFTKAGAKGLHIDGATHGLCILNRFYNCRFWKSSINLEIDGTANFNSFYGCSFNNGGIGLYTKPVGANKPNFNVFRECDFEANSNFGIDDNSNRLTVEDGYFELNEVDVRCGNEAVSVQPIIRAKAIGRTYSKLSYTFGAYGCDSGIIENPGGESILDGKASLPAEATSYTVSFPANYSFATRGGDGYMVAVEVNWETTVQITYGYKAGTGFRIDFGTATPDANRSVWWKVFVKSL
jgi:hypothetical protein